MKLLIGIFFIGIFSAAVDGRCNRGCDTALASYYVWRGSNLTFITQMLQPTSVSSILNYNRNRTQISGQDYVQAGTRVNVPFSCDCIGGEFLGHVFTFRTFPGVTYETIARTYYSNLTTTEWLQRFNSYPAVNIPDTGVALNVTVNCSCGNQSVSEDYGLFITYPLRPEDSLESVAAANNLTTDVVSRYNPGVNFSAGSGLVYIPGTDQNGNFPRLNPSKGLSGGAIAGISVAGIVGVLLFAGCLYVGLQRKKNAKKIQLLSTSTEGQLQQGGRDTSFGL